MYFIFNKENNRFFGGMNGAGRYIFEGFSALDDCVRCVIFSSEVDACATGNVLIRDGYDKVSVHPISEFESLANRRN